MRITLIVPACFAVIVSDVRADVALCTSPARGQPQGKFEVWQEPLPAPDYLDGLDACIARSGYAVPRAPSSLWAENQRTTYTNALKKRPVDVLVAPFQIQGYGLERTERAIMSADLAYHLDPAVRVADPFLTARALGEGARRYDRNNIVELARAVGAQTVVVGYVGHDLAHRMTVTVQVLEVGDSGVVEIAQKDWRGVPFTHFDPPFVVFHRMLPSVLESLSLPAARQPHARATLEFPDKAPFSFADLAADKHPLGASLGLSVLGAMTSSIDERSRERLFERALVASWHFDTPSAETSFLQAYALLNLEHRPAALARINGSFTPEAVALRALLNGDLPGASAAVAKVQNPLKRLMLGVHVDDLRHTYEKPDMKQATAAESVFGEDAADWLILAEGRSNDANVWRVDEAVALKFLLDGVYPVTGLGIQSVLGGGQVVGASVDDVAVDVATMRHVARFVESAEAPVCCSADSARAAAWDLVALLEGRTEARMSKSLFLTNVTRAAPESSTDAIERYRSVFEGNPLFAVQRTFYARAMSERTEGDELQRWLREVHDHALVATAWSPGQNRVARDGALKLGVQTPEGARYFDVYGFDYPRRSYWPPYLIRTGAGAPNVATLFDALGADALAYARTDIAAFAPSPFASEPNMPMLVAELEARLVGHPHRVGLLASFRPPPPSSGDPVVDAKAAVSEDPENWDVRLAAGRRLIEQYGKWEEAAALVLAHPYFHRDSPPNAVNVSNDAFEAGSIFYWGGHEELAIPFYEVAANLPTGASSQMASQIRLDILAGRYQSAAAGSYVRAQRYPGPYPLRDLLSFLHALGYPEEAWNGFSQVAAEFDNPQVWVSALVGQRREGLTEPEIRAWLKQPGIRDARFRGKLFAPRYAVLVNASDHEPPEDLAALVAELEGETGINVVRREVHIPSPDNPSATIQVPRSGYAWDRSMSRPPDGPARSELSFFGAAYTAIRRGQFESAVDEFEAMANHYPIESGEYAYALPYFAWAAAKTGDTGELENFIEGHWMLLTAFELNLSRAFFHGVRKDAAQARELLDTALRSRPLTDSRPVLVEYQWAEACEWLYKETGDKGFVDMLLAWVVSQQKVQPTQAWPYAMEYTYARTPERKLRALAMTLYLDPESPRIRAASTKERADAEAWGAANNLFLKDEDPPESGGPIAMLRADESVRLTGA